MSSSPKVPDSPRPGDSRPTASVLSTGAGSARRFAMSRTIEFSRRPQKSGLAARLLSLLVLVPALLALLVVAVAVALILVAAIVLGMLLLLCAGLLFAVGWRLRPRPAHPF